MSLFPPITLFLRRLTCRLAALFCLCGLSPALSQESFGEDAGAKESDWTLGIAVGAGKRNNPFVGSDDISLNAIMDLAWYGDRWFFDNGDLGLMLKETSQLSVNALLTFNNERNYFSYLNNGSSGLDIRNLRQIASDQGLGSMGIAGGEEQDIDTLTVEQLEEIIYANLDSSLPKRKFAVNSGLEMLYISAWGDLQAQMLTDVSGVHNGQSVWASYAYPWKTLFSEFSLTLGMEWKSRDLVDYYYGVRPHERIAGRPEYRGKAGINGVIRITASHALTERWRLVAVLEQEHLSKSIQRSPIIKRGTVNTAFLGLYYQFK